MNEQTGEFEFAGTRPHPDIRVGVCHVGGLRQDSKVLWRADNCTFREWLETLHTLEKRGYKVRLVASHGRLAAVVEEFPPAKAATP